MMEEKTCICVFNYDNIFHFQNKREYQVDVYPLFCCVYNNGGWDDYVFIGIEEFKKYFKIIE